jgi:hypothetical protein
MRLTALSCAFLACGEFNRESVRFLFSTRASPADIVYMLPNVSSMFALGLLLMLWQFLIRWHFMNRLEHLSESVESLVL